MKELLAFLMLFPWLFSANKGAAQSSSRFAIVISPALFVPVTVALQAGVQYKASRRFSVLMEAAVPLFHPNNTEYEKIDYLRTGIEFKYMLEKDSSLSKYFAIQTTYLFRELVDNDQAFYYTKTQTFSYTNATIKSPVVASALKVGIQLGNGKRFFADVFFGIGLRFVLTEYVTKNALLTSTAPPEQRFFKFDDAWLYNYTLLRPHATGGMKLGIRL